MELYSVISMLDLKSVVQAISVADYLSIRRAAGHLGLQPSAVSRRIQGLEDQLGVSLFERYSTGVQPTFAGHRFLNRARWALAELDYAVRSATSVQKGDAGSLTIAFYPSLASGFLHQILAEHRARFPHVEFGFLEAAPADQLVAVRQHRADVAFLLAASEAPGVDSEFLWDEPISVALPESHPLTERRALSWADLRSEKFVVRAYGSGPFIYAWLAARLHPGGFAPTITQHDICRESLLSLVGAGYGLTVVSGSATALMVPGVAFRPVEDQDATVAIRMAWMGDNENPALGRFLSHARRVSRQSEDPH